MGDCDEALGPFGATARGPALARQPEYGGAGHVLSAQPKLTSEEGTDDE